MFKCNFGLLTSAAITLLTFCPTFLPRLPNSMQGMNMSGAVSVGYSRQRRLEQRLGARRLPPYLWNDVCCREIPSLLTHVNVEQARRGEARRGEARRRPASAARGIIASCSWCRVNEAALSAPHFSSIRQQ